MCVGGGGGGGGGGQASAPNNLRAGATYPFGPPIIQPIGVGRFRILGGPRFRILGGPRGGQIPSRHMTSLTTSMRRNDVASTSFRLRVPIRFLINQCQIITFLILKYDIIENSRIELRGIVLPIQMGWIIGGAPKGMCWPPPPPLKLLGGGGAWPPWPPPLPTPMQPPYPPISM